MVGRGSHIRAEKSKQAGHRLPKSQIRRKIRATKSDAAAGTDLAGSIKWLPSGDGDISRAALGNINA